MAPRPWIRPTNGKLILRKAWKLHGELTGDVMQLQRLEHAPMPL